jgi:endoglucanase
MKVAMLVLVQNVALVVGCTPDAQTPTPVRPSPGRASLPASAPDAVLRRGINVGNALDAPSEGAWGVVLSSETFEAIRVAGFDHVRIPVRFSAHAASSAPYTVDEAFFRRVDWAIEEVVSRGMTAIVDLHHYEELMEQPASHAARFLGLWAQIAARYARRPPSVVYELLNEPTKNLMPELWNPLLAEALRVVRAADPERTVIVDSTSWAAAKDLAFLVLPPDARHVLASFHMYQPILFTHQGMPWMPPEFGTTGVVYPGPPEAPLEPAPAAQRVDWVRDWIARYDTAPAAQNPSGPAAVVEQFEMARAFVERTHVAVYMGEFGAGDKADLASRVRWTRAVRHEAERRGIGWAWWHDGGAFKVYDEKARSWIPELRAALVEGVPIP